MRLLPWLAIFACLLPCSVRAAPSPPIDLPRSEKWNVIWDKESCSLVGVFGSGKEQIITRFVQFAPGSSFSLQVFGKAFRNDSPTMKVGVDFGPVENGRDHLALTGMVKDLYFADLGSNRFDDLAFPKDGPALPAITPEQEAETRTLTLKPEHGRRFRLMTGSMFGPMRAMRTCMTDLIKTWGYDPLVQASLSRPATPVTAQDTWLRSSDYPRGMVMMGASAIVQFRLDIDEAGLVSGCHVHEVTKAEDFTDVTCRALTARARIIPALDAQGKPVRSFIVGQVRWVVDAP